MDNVRYIIEENNMSPFVLVVSPVPFKIVNFLNRLVLEDISKNKILAKWMANHNRACLIKGVI